MPLLSIITPVYRTGDLLRRCLQSICEITLQDWECIVVNDGTDDGSFEIAKEFAEKDNRFVLIDNTENHGVSYARNQALDIAKGTWVTFLDSDDFTYPNDYKTIIEEAQNNNVSFLYRFGRERHSGLYSLTNVADCFAYTPHLYKNEVIQKHNLRFNEKASFAEDALFNVFMYAYCENVYYSPQKFVYCKEDHFRVPHRKWLSLESCADSYLQFVDEFKDPKYEALKTMFWNIFYINFRFSPKWRELTHKTINEKTLNLKFLSIGSNCAGIGFLGKARLRGPVDNVVVKNLGFKKLFDNTLYEEITETQPQISSKFQSWENDSLLSYSFQSVDIIHNNPFEDSFKKELKKRLERFNNFYENIHNEENYFIYSLSNLDVDKWHNPTKYFSSVIQALTDLNILDKVIFVGTKRVCYGRRFWKFYFNEAPKGIKYVTVFNNYFEYNGTEESTYQKICHEDFLEKVSSLLFN